MTTLADAIATPSGVTINGTIGRQAAAASKSVALATDDSAALAAIGTKLNASIAVTGTFWQATQPVSGTVAATQSGTWNVGSITTLPALVAGTAIIGKVGIDQTTPGTTNLVAAGQSGTWNITNISGTVSLPTGAATSAAQTTLQTAIGSSSDTVLTTGNAGSHSSYLRTIMEQTLSTSPSSVKIDQTTPGTTNAASISHIGSTAVASGNGVVGTGVQRVAIASDNTAFSVNATSTPATTAHALIPAPSSHVLPSSAATTNATNIKGSAGTVKGIQGFNNKASAVRLKFFDKATAPTTGTDSAKKSIYLPASAAFAIDFGTGISFSLGIGYALTTGSSLTDNTAVASGDITDLNVDYH